MICLSHFSFATLIHLLFPHQFSRILNQNFRISSLYFLSNILLINFCFSYWRIVKWASLSSLCIQLVSVPCLHAFLEFSFMRIKWLPLIWHYMDILLSLYIFQVFHTFIVLENFSLTLLQDSGFWLISRSVFMCLNLSIGILRSLNVINTCQRIIELHLNNGFGFLHLLMYALLENLLDFLTINGLHFIL